MRVRTFTSCLCTVASAISFSVSNGQDQAALTPNANHEQSLRIGVNAAMFTSGDMIGIGNYAEYGYAFNDHLAIVPRVMGAFANSMSGNKEYRASQFGASVSARITPLPAFYLGLKLDLGAVYQTLPFHRHRFQ
ncbi:MAG: hypothetical protein M3R08_08840 [Bacteroidota bacterium]|nr:hypothetical protein [Bacteroidota bacterium]